MSESVGASVLPDGRRVDDLKVTDLRKELELRGLSRTGVKKELCARLSNALDSDITFSESITDKDEKSNVPERILDHVDDTLEIDALNSDEDVDTSVNTVIHVSNTNGSDNLDSSHDNTSQSNAILENPVSQENANTLESVADMPGSRVLDCETSTPSADHEAPTTKLPVRRRQWGMRNTSNSIPLSSESIQKLIPSPITPSVTGGSTETPPVLNNDIFVTCEDKLTDGESKSKIGEGRSVIEREEELEVHVLESIDGEDSGLNDGLIREPPSDRSSHSKISEKSTRESLKNERLDSTSDIQERPMSRLQSHQLDYSSETPQDLLKKSPPVKRKGPKETKAVGYLIELPERIEPSQPAKHPPTDIVYIRFLVRPFTAEQLRQMVSRFGTVLDLWLDRIKSTSLVRMCSTEEATNCRDNLDGSRWPSMNPRVLRCDFASDELFDWMKANAESGELQPPVHLLLGIKPPEDHEHITSKIRKHVSKQEASSKTGDGNSSDLRRHLERTGRDSDQSRSERSKPFETKDDKTAGNGAKTEEPAKLLNDLFCKTTATPSIYWLPLTKEQARKQNDERRRKYALKRSLEASHSERKATRSPFANPTSSEPLSPPRKSAHLSASTSENRKSEKVSHHTSKTNETTKVTAPKKSTTTTGPSDGRTSSMTDSKSKPKTTKSENSNHSDRIEKPTKHEVTPKTGVKNERSSDVHRKREHSPFTSDRKKQQHPLSETLEQPTSAKQSRVSNNLNSDNPPKQKISKSPEKGSKISTEKTEPVQPHSTSTRSGSTASKIKSLTDRPSNDSRRKSASGSRSDRHRSKSLDRRGRSPSHGRYHSRR